MTKTGIVKKWDAAKGYGFIRSQAIPADVFFHHKAFESTVGLLPCEGLAVRFEEINVGGKGPRATHVKPVVDRQTTHSPRAQPGLDAIVAKAEAPLALTLIRPHRSSHLQANSVKKINPAKTGSAGRPAVTAAPPGLFAYLSLLMIWLGLLVAGLMMQRFSVWVLAALAALNVITLFAYAFDKNAAERGGWLACSLDGTADLAAQNQQTFFSINLLDDCCVALHGTGGLGIWPATAALAAFDLKLHSISRAA